MTNIAASDHSPLRLVSRRNRWTPYLFIWGLLITVLPAAALQAQAQTTVFGPNVYQQTKEDNQYHVNFSISNLSGTFTLVFENGAPNDNWRVSDGSVKLNGVEVIGENDFKKSSPRVVQKTVTLRTNNTLDIELEGKKPKAGDPPFYITLRILQQGADTTAPNITVNQPQSGQVFATSPITVTGTVTDASGVASFTINGIATALTNNAFSKQIQLTLGSNTIALMATDIYGNSSQRNVVVTFDNVPPQITITQPTPGQVFGQSPIMVTGSVTDNVGVGGVTVNGSAATITNGTFKAAVALGAGNNAINAVATDTAGNSRSAATSAILDNANPQVTIASPVNGLLTRNQSISASGTATDDVGVASVAVNGRAATLNGTAYSVIVPLSIEGSNPLNAVATDVVGKQGSATVTVIRDTTPPSLTVTAPVDGTTLNSNTTTVVGDATDASGVASVTVNNTSVTLGPTGHFEQSVTLQEGPNTITVRATDRADNTASVSLSVGVTLDVAPPQIGITTPTGGFLVNTPGLSVTGTATDDKQVASVVVNGQQATLVGSNTNKSFTANVALVEGANTITAVATDGTGKTAMAAVSGILDTIQPVITLLSPADNAVVNTAGVMVVGDVADANGVASVMVNGNGAPLSNGHFEAPVTLVDGINTISVKATDNAGNMSNVNRTLTLDRIPPQLNVASPADGFLTKNQTLQVNGSVSDNLALASLRVNGQTVTPANGTFTTSLTLAEGANAINAVATDTAGNQTTVTVNGTLDTIAPALNVQTPSPGQIISATPVTVGGTVSDTSGIQSVTVNGNQATVANGGFTALATLNPGNNTIVVIATDNAGNSTMVNVPTLLDSAPPVISITSPANGLLTNVGAQQVTGTATDDSSVASVTVNNQPAVLNGSSFTATLTLVEGSNTITAVATDAANKTATASVNAILDATPPTINLTSPTNGQATGGETIRVTGDVSDANGVASLTINGSPVGFAGGHFDMGIALQVGNNPIVVMATDNAGNIRTVNLQVSRFAPIHVTITSPAPQTIFGAGPTSITVTGTVDDPNATVQVNGINAVVSGGTLTATITLHEGINLITATASDTNGANGAASISVLHDTSAPIVRIDAPSEGAVLTTSTTMVTGNVNDVVSGTVNGSDVTITVNGVPATVANRTFVVPELLLTRGQNTLTAVARDRAGNEGRHQIQITFQDPAGQQRIAMVSGNNQSGVIGATLAQPLVVQLVDAGGNALPGLPVTFRVRRSDGIIRALPQEGQQITVNSDENGFARVQFQLGTRLGVGNNEVDVTAAGFTGEVIFCESSSAGTPGQIHAAMVMGDNYRGTVGQTFATPLQVIVTDQGGNPVVGIPVTFQVEKGDGNIGGQPAVTQNTSSDGKTSVLFTIGPQEGISNNVLSATFAGNATPVFFTISGATPGATGDTRVSGIVLDNTNRPIPGATAKIVGFALQAVSDDQGQFTIHNAPVGTIALIVDGKTSTRPETFPFLAYNLINIAGQDNTVGSPIFLPFLDSANSKIVGGDQDVILTMKDVPGVQYTVFANSVRNPDGSRYVGPLTLSQVHSDKVPMALPNGTSPTVVGTLQPAGLHFIKPIRVQYPNTDGLTPGQVVEVFSFDHALEQFVSGGTARVTADGAFVVSDPGYGITVSGWHAAPPPPPPKKCVGGCGQCKTCILGFCVPKPFASCDDGNECTENDRCTLGLSCKGSPATNGMCCNGVKIDPAKQGCCDGKTYDLETQCCAGSNSDKIVQKNADGQSPIKPDDCPNRSQNSRPHEYDGCSLPGWVVSTLGVADKDNPAGGRDTQFSDAACRNTQQEANCTVGCDLHDTCYQTCSTDDNARLHCDESLRDTAIVRCNASTEAADVRESCRKYARTYYRGLRLGGGGAFKDRQKQYCKCCN